MLAEHFFYGLLWVGFGASHSYLAGERLIRPFGVSSRLLYNAISLVSIVGIFAIGRHIFASDIGSFTLHPVIEITKLIGLVAGIAVAVLGLATYDAGSFIGFSQLRGSTKSDPSLADEPLHISGIHRYVRHPLYAGAMLALWANISDQFTLSTAIWATIYIVIGTKFEERRLIRTYGDEYVAYRNRVPAFLPFKRQAN